MIDRSAPQPTVLVVEGAAPTLAAATGAVADAGYRVVAASNAAVALRLMAQGLVPDVLVTGVKMLGSINGLALAHIVAARWPRIAILICAGQGQPQAGEAPAGAVLMTGPFGATLLEQVATLCPRPVPGEA